MAEITCLPIEIFYNIAEYLDFDDSKMLFISACIDYKPIACNIYPATSYNYVTENPVIKTTEYSKYLKNIKKLSFITVGSLSYIGDTFPFFLKFKNLTNLHYTCLGYLDNIALLDSIPEHIKFTFQFSLELTKLEFTSKREFYYIKISYNYVVFYGRLYRKFKNPSKINVFKKGELYETWDKKEIEKSIARRYYKIHGNREKKS